MAGSYKWASVRERKKAWGEGTRTQQSVGWTVEFDFFNTIILFLIIVKFLTIIIISIIL